MIWLIKGQSGVCALLLALLFVRAAAGQLLGEECFAQFKKGRQDFVLDADDSVKAGATFISSPKLNGNRDCVQACCKDSRCNVAFMERGEKEGSISSCFLFDCLYKQKYVCRFVSRKGYDSYIQDKVYDGYHVADTNPDEDDRRPVADGGPDQVVQPQDRLILNGIQSKDDNGIVSFKWKMLTEYPYALYEDSSYKDQMIVSNLTSGKYKFQLTVTDTIGQSDSAYVNVLVLTPEQIGHHCMAPKKIGPCRGSFPRWHYNGASEKCESFTFGGCKENLNNYVSEDECIKACHKSGGASGRGLHLPTLPTLKEKCGAPCSAEQFTCANGCCLDPGLECDSTPQCSDGSDELSCENLNDKFQILLQIPHDEKTVHCTEHPVTGSCRDSITKWYYNPYEATCFRFNYGGCLGNENRFDSEESCMTYCRGVTENDVFIRSKPEAQMSDNQSGILALAIVLGVAIVIVVAILLYRFLKTRKSSQHQRLPVSNATLTSMDTDRLVYNSTTKPI